MTRTISIAALGLLACGQPGAGPDAAGAVDTASSVDAANAPDAATAPLSWYPGNYALLVQPGPSKTEADALAAFLDSALADDFTGVQIVYAWSVMEPTENSYGVAGIATDLAVAAAHGKKVIIQTQYKTFDPEGVAVPAYLLVSGSEYCVGTVCGQYRTSNAWMPMLWQGATEARLQAWLSALATAVAQDPNRDVVAGFTLPESAVGQGSAATLSEVMYNADTYLAALEANAQTLSASASGIPITQYLNEYSPDGGTLGTDFDYLTAYTTFATQHPPIGIGCPDVASGTWGKDSVPTAYPILLDSSYHGVVPFNVSVQQTDYEAPRAASLDATYAVATGSDSGDMAAQFVNWQDIDPPGAVFGFSDAAPYVMQHPDPNSARPTW